MARAIYYPSADRTSQWFAGAYPGSTMALTAPVIVGHTTEGGYGWPGYQGGAVAPTLTALPILSEKRLAWRQHFPINMSARALKNLAGGVQTNTAGAVQIELCGTCVKGGPGMYWPEAPDWAIRGVADFIDWFRSEWPMPQGLRLPPRGFRLFENLKGDGQRMTFDEWVNFSGVCEHQNVPENDHGDASGAWGRAVALLTNPTSPPPPPPPQEDDMPSLQELKTDVDRHGPDGGWSLGDAIASRVSGEANHSLEVLVSPRLAAIEAALGTLPKSIADQIKVPAPDPAAIAAAIPADLAQQVADELGKRLSASAPQDAARDLFADSLPPAEAAPEVADAPDLDKSAPSPQGDTPGHD